MLRLGMCRFVGRVFDFGEVVGLVFWFDTRFVYFEWGFFRSDVIFRSGFVAWRVFFFRSGIRNGRVVSIEVRRSFIFFICNYG